MTLPSIEVSVSQINVLDIVMVDVISMYSVHRYEFDNRKFVLEVNWVENIYFCFRVVAIQFGNSTQKLISIYGNSQSFGSR